MKEKYQLKCNRRNEEITLSMHNSEFSDVTALGELDTFRDRHIVFATQAPLRKTATGYGASSPLFIPDTASNDLFGSRNPSSGFGSFGSIAQPSDESAPFALIHKIESADTPKLDGEDGMGPLEAAFLTEEQKAQLASDSQARTDGMETTAINSEQNLRKRMSDYNAFGSQKDDEVPFSGFDYAADPVDDPFANTEPMEGVTLAPQSALQELLEENQPEILEIAVKKANSVLSVIEQPLRTAPRDIDARNWLTRISEVRDITTKNRTVIGVVGNTGAGKSSVINAVLEEERLVPTNCMRACTAVVTEISYNDSSNPSARYRAEIEFIQPEEWRRELTLLFDDVFGDQAMSKEAQNPDSLVGIAYAKIRAVYHKHTTEMLQSSSVDELMNLKSVQSLLGTVKRIQSYDCKSFYQRLQHYVDSKQKKNTSPHGKGKSKAKSELEHWPMIKVVRIYAKASALATGAVLVDLPGVQDSNAARAAVADGYMKMCSGIWIVAPITRAVDDKSAKTMLNRTFKRQLKFDGTYSAVTFICSKTDDISRTEAEDALGLGRRLEVLEDLRGDILEKKRAAKSERQKVRDDQESQLNDLEQCEAEIELWDGFARQLQNGKTAHAPATQGKKRKRTSENKDLDIVDGQELTDEQVQLKLDDTKRRKKALRNEGLNLRGRLRKVDQVLEELVIQESELGTKADAICIEERNEWSRGRIQHDFADGIRELDQDTAQEEDPQNFDPLEELRDYEEVARSLPVFCVSSRAYQKLSNRLTKDSGIASFATKAQTQIPQLQAHCRKLTEKGRQAECKRYLNSINQLLTSLSLWASHEGSLSQLDSKQRNALEAAVSTNLRRLEKALETATSHTMNDFVGVVQEQLIDKFDSAGQKAASEASDTANGWGAPLEQGGLFWATYKATVRRNGEFAGSSGSRNFNIDLTDPLYKELGTPWETTFQRYLPAILQSFPTVVATTLNDFHNAVESHCRKQCLDTSRIARLKVNLPLYESAFSDLVKTTIIHIQEAQREVNREFTPRVAANMQPVYLQCGQQKGELSLTTKRLRNRF